MEKKTALKFDDQPPPYSVATAEQPSTTPLPEKPASSSSFVVNSDVDQHFHDYGNDRRPELIPKPQIVTSDQESDIIFGPHPKTLLCVVCNRTVTTKVVEEPAKGKNEFKNALRTYGFCLCLRCVHFNVFRTINHYCSNCNAYQGSFKPQS